MAKLNGLGLLPEQNEETIEFPFSKERSDLANKLVTWAFRNTERALPSSRCAIGARPYPRPSACASHYVYQEGGEPAYFGTPSDKCDMARLSLRIGGLQVGCNQPGDRWHLGLSANQRRRAAYRSFVFHVDDVDEACSALKSEGFRPSFEESATIMGGATRRMDAAEFCADAVARAILRPSTRLSNEYHATMMTFSAFANSDGPISKQISREIIREGLVVVSPSDFRKSFGIAQDWARNAMDRLDRRFPSPALSPEEDEILFQMEAG